jgi:4'-phosphopantetheinyl transferase
MPDWPSPSSAPHLATGEVHVWRIDLDIHDDCWQTLTSLLSNDEHAKAERFHFAKHRRRHTVTHAALRILLGQYLACPPRNIAFGYNTHGKPRLAGEDQRIRFNLSHTEDIMLVAFALDSEVGIDIEAVTRNVDYMGVGRRWFSALESRTLQSLPEHERVDAFFRAWCRKEAYIKARGEGMAHPLQRFSVALDKHEPRLVEHLDDNRETSRWTFIDIDVAENYRATVVAETADWQVDCYRLDMSLYNP